MAGVNYLPKYDAVILDEAHTVEDVAGEHFGLKVSEAGVRYQLRGLYDPKRGRGMLSTHGSAANDAIRDVVEAHRRAEAFFDAVRPLAADRGPQQRPDQPSRTGWTTTSPHVLRNLALHIKAMLATIEKEEEVSELTATADKVSDAGPDAGRDPGPDDAGRRLLDRGAGRGRAGPADARVCRRAAAN